MIFRNGREIVDIHKGGKAATALYKGSRLVWEAVKSCFGRGMWIEAKPWVNTDGWRNDR